MFLLYITKLNRIERKKIGYIELLNILILFLYAYFVVDPIFYLLGSTSHMQHTINEIGWSDAFSAIILAPLLEEFIFRKSLSGYKRHIWYVLLLPLALMLFSFKLGFFLLLGIVLCILIFSYDRFTYALTGKYYNWLVFTSVIIFSILHIIHIDDIDSIIIKLALCLITFAPTALYFTYVRVRYGLVFAVLAHSLSNGLTLFINSLIYT